MNKLDKHFVSEIDKKLAEFDATHPKSPAQQAEYDKYQCIYRMRDVPTAQLADKKDDIWA